MSDSLELTFGRNCRPRKTNVLQIAKGQSQALARYLPDRRKKRRQHARKPRGLVFPPDYSIHERPDYVKDRSTFGEWAGDLKIFSRNLGKANVASLIECKTHFAVLFCNNDRSSPHLMNRFMENLEPEIGKLMTRPAIFDREACYLGWGETVREALLPGK